MTPLYKIEAVTIFLERRKTRMTVGRLTREGQTYIFTYDEKYFSARNAFSLGPEFPLTQREFRSSLLFPSLEDRIPSRANPAYPEYCHSMGISVEERDPLVLLSTIGRRGPSSFVFAPVFERSFSGHDVKEFRKTLGLTTREFAHIFEISQSSLTALEQGKLRGKDLLKRLEFIVLFPDTALYMLTLHGGILHNAKLRHAISAIKSNKSVN